jgi:ribonuclease P protein component
MRETFHKSERLCSRSRISQLFRSGRGFTSPPFRVQWLAVPLSTQFPVQVMISVPKSLFPRSSDRNLLKRRIREAYRRNKQSVYGPLAAQGKQIILILTYNTRETLPYEEIRRKIIVLLQRLNEAVEKPSG